MTHANPLKNLCALALAGLLAAGALTLAGCGEQQQDNTVQSATPAATQGSQDSSDASQAGSASDEQDNCYGDDLPVINTEAK